MNKIWFFVEGNSEEFFIINLIRNYFYEKLSIIKDLSEFVNLKISNFTTNICYCENCGSVNRIPYAVNEMYYLIEKSLSNNIIIICDVEDLKCHSNRKTVITNKLNNIDKLNIKYIFFNPMIENYYWDCPEIIKRIISIDYRKRFSRELFLKSIPNSISRDLNGLKHIFKTYKIKYRESLFAEKYFSRINYNTCQHIILKRTIDLINSCI